MIDPLNVLVDMVRHRLDDLLLVAAIGVLLSASALIVSNSDGTNPFEFLGRMIEIRGDPTPVPPAPSPSPSPSPSPAPTPVPIIEFDGSGNMTVVGNVSGSPSPSPPAPANFTESGRVPVAPMEGDVSFYEDYRHPEKDYALAAVPDAPYYNSGTSRVVVDLNNCYFGRVNPFPGDTVGMRLRLYNPGAAIQDNARVNLTIDKRIDTPLGAVWLDNLLQKSFYTPISIGENMAVIKNMSYTIPLDGGLVDISGYYRVTANISTSQQGYFTFTEFINIQ